MTTTTSKAQAVRAAVDAVIGLAQSEQRERSALDTLDSARHGIASGIVAVGQILTAPGAPPQRQVAEGVKAEGYPGWSQPTLSRVVTMYRAASLLGLLDEGADDGVDTDKMIKVRSLVVDKVTVKRDGAPDETVHLSKIVGLLVREGEQGKGAFTSVMTLSKAAHALAQGKPLPSRSDAGVARVEPGADAGPAPVTTDGGTAGRGAEVTPPVPDDVSAWADTVHALRGWTGHLTSTARMVETDGSADGAHTLTRADATAILSGLAALDTASKALTDALLVWADVNDDDVPDAPAPEQKATPRKGKAHAAA